MPTIYDNYEDVMSQIIGTPVTSSYVAAYYTTYAYIDSKGYAYALSQAQMDELFPLQIDNT